MKILKILIIIIIIIAIVFGIVQIKNSISNISKTKIINEGINSVINNIDVKGINSGTIQNSLSGKIDEAKGYAEQYYNEVLKDYVDKTKNGISGAIEDAKGYYNQGVDELGNTITNEINSKIVEGLDKIKIN